MINKIEKYLTTKNISWFIFISIIFSHLIIALGNENAAMTWFNDDDVFYYFKVAKNVAEGNGFTFDGMNLSNGFHPLWMAICIPIFSLAKFNLILPLRIVIIVLGFLHAGAGALLYRMLKRFLPTSFSLLITFSWIYSLFIHSEFIIGGLESGISAFFLIFLWERITFIIHNKSTINLIPILWTTGLIASLTILSRLDNVFVVFFGGVWLWFSFWNNPSDEGDQGWVWRFKTGVAYNLPIIIILVSYLIWNKTVFGTYMPVSGQIKIWWGTFYDTVYGIPIDSFTGFLADIFSDSKGSGPFYLVTRYLIKFGEWLMPIFGQDPKRLMIKRFLIMLSFMGGILLILLKGVLHTLWLSIKKLGLPYFLAGIIIHVTYYKATGSVGQRTWYWVGENLLIYLSLGVTIHAAWQYFNKFNYIKTVEYALLFSIVGFQLFGFGKHIQGRRRLAFQNIPHEYLEMATSLESEFPAGSTIGLTGSGGIGYFSENFTIINLDGLINSYEYFQMMKEGTAHELLSDSGLEYIVGNGYMITESSPYRQIFSDHIEPSQYKSPGNGVWNFIP